MPAMTSQTSPTNTRARTLKAAQGLLQSFGYNGFSFQHVADLVGIKKPSLYEHFESKEQLGKALISDYRQRFEEWNRVVDSFDPGSKVNALFTIFYGFAKDKKKCCPLTAMTAELNSLPSGLRNEIRKMQVQQAGWLEKVIAEGKKSKQFKSALPAAELAEVLMTLCYGSQLSARIANNPKLILRSRDHGLRILGAKASKVFQK